ncbi:MAG: winged helix-turn-helix transcriptional regulator [Chloroflexota bacterium]|nr:winged helix-turn-helix transcriptional regulator [Chloroflexota bacterium]
MAEILRKKNLASKLQILVEVAAHQPEVQQRDIAKRLGLSPQAVSDYVKELVADGWLTSDRRSSYRVTPDGVDWILRELREWQNYYDIIQQAIANIAVSAAIADCDIEKGQKVGLVVRDGILAACDDCGAVATGLAVSSARKGEDVGVTQIEGIVPLDVGTVSVFRVPSIRRGGSRNVDRAGLRKAIKDTPLVAAIGLEALVALRRIGTEPAFFYGVPHAVVEAARSGLSPVVVCVDDDTADLIRMLEEKRVEYELIDGRRDHSDT